MAAISGIDIALWDLKGQLTGQPLYRLLGGTAVDQVPCYATGHYFRKAPEDIVLKTILAEASQHVALGFSALKLKIGKNPAFDHKAIVAVRNQFPDVILMADANHAYNLNEAVKIGRTLDEYSYTFFEEPIAPHHYNDFAKLRAKLDLAIATGECEQTRYGFRTLVESGGVDILQPDLAFCGGISEGVKIRALADSFGISVTPHAWGTWIGFAAALHFHATAPPNPGRHENQLCFLECDNSENPVKDNAFAEKIEIRDGSAILPQGPGLGVRVETSVLKQFVV
jgi:D-galactarolactone cycloisomerase